MQEEAAGCIFALFRFQHHTLALNLNAAAPLSPIIHNRESRRGNSIYSALRGPRTANTGAAKAERVRTTARQDGGGGTEARGVGEDSRVAPAPRNSHVC